MPKSKVTLKQSGIEKKQSTKATPAAKGLDVLVAGPLLLVPEVSGKVVTGVEVFFPQNDHPIGALFLPGVYFSDAQLEDPDCAAWPPPADFSLLDAHGYVVDLQQDAANGKPKFQVSQVPKSNPIVRKGRRISSAWALSIRVVGGLAGWSQHRFSPVRAGQYYGADAPTAGVTAAMHRLSFKGVTGADFLGASAAARGFLNANGAQGGTLIVMGEVPYQPSLLHERKAIEALAQLAGLDLYLEQTEPTPHRSRLMMHTQNCGLSIILSE